MRIGIVAARLSGTDGVSLEVGKWVQVLEGLGHEVHYCAGELGGYAAGGKLVPRMHFNDPMILSLTRAIFNKGTVLPPEKILEEIDRISAEIKAALFEFIHANKIDLLIAENALAIPMNLPLAKAFSEVSVESGLPAIAHHHDYYWERERFQTNLLPEFIETYFPPDLPTMRHVSINSIAQRRLKQRRNIDSVVIPNVIDFSQPGKKSSGHPQAFRKALGLAADEPLIVQPTRVIQRKGIEMAIELLSRMALKQPKLFITHAAGDEGLDYWHWLQHEADMMGVSLQLVDRLVQDHAGEHTFSLGDMYDEANLVTYPSTYEGFGNALIETVYYKRPVVVNRYPVYNSDIRPLGFQFIELDGFVSDEAVASADRIIQSPAFATDMIETNYALAEKNFSLQVLQQKLIQVLATV